MRWNNIPCEKKQLLLPPHKHSTNVYSGQGSLYSCILEQPACIYSFNLSTILFSLQRPFVYSIHLSTIFICLQYHPTTLFNCLQRSYICSFHLSEVWIWTRLPHDGKQTGSPLDQWDMVRMQWGWTCIITNVFIKLILKTNSYKLIKRELFFEKLHLLQNLDCNS
jgi:hypothetical protein